MISDKLVERLDRVIFDIEYPPWNSEFTKGDVLQLLKDARKFIVRLEESENNSVKDVIDKIKDKLFDIDYAMTEIENLLEEL